MAIKGKYTGSGAFSVAEEGRYAVKCVSLSVEQGKDFNDPAKLVDNFRWELETIQKTDKHGVPYRFTRWTGISYGKDAANLTQLLDGMLGRRLTREEFAVLNLEHFVGQAFYAMIGVKRREDGKEVNQVISVKRPTDKPLPVEDWIAADREAEAKAQATAQSAQPEPEPDTPGASETLQGDDFPNWGDETADDSTDNLDDGMQSVW